MLFVALLSVKAGTPKENMARRAQWTYPEGVKTVAEYWLQTNNPTVISILEAASTAPLMQISAEWGDVFDITIVPAITGEKGMQIAQRMAD